MCWVSPQQPGYVTWSGTFTVRKRLFSEQVKNWKGTKATNGSLSSLLYCHPYFWDREGEGIGDSHSWKFRFRYVVYDNFDWIAMDILREFLETSTIHGLTYISSARVSFCWAFYLFIISFLPDQVGKGSLVFNCLSWVHRGWNPNWEVLQGLAGKSYRHLDHDPPHRRPRLPCCDHLSSEGLQHRPLPWSC